MGHRWPIKGRYEADGLLFTERYFIFYLKSDFLLINLKQLDNLSINYGASLWLRLIK